MGAVNNQEKENKNGSKPCTRVKEMQGFGT